MNVCIQGYAHIQSLKNNGEAAVYTAGAGCTLNLEQCPVFKSQPSYNECERVYADYGYMRRYIYICVL